MKIPNLFILGAQKAGTTYLAQVLSEHPDVFFSSPKETMFFSKKQERTQADYERYCEEVFGGAADEIWRAEGSTTYLQWGDALDRVKHFVNGRPRFIVCLRQPTTKAISFYIHNWRRGRYDQGSDLSSAIKKGIELSPFETSLYADSIERWLDAYSYGDFLFLKFDDLVKNPAEFSKKATKFLGICDVESVPDEQINAGLPLSWDGDALTVKSSATRQLEQPRFSMNELEDLHGLFLPDIKRTEELTNLDLSDWYSMPQFASS